MKLFLVLLLCALAANEPTAREYYEELKASGTLHRNGDEYACFDDDDKPNFTIMAKVSDIIAKASERNDELTLQRMKGRENSLVVLPYNKGIAAELQIYDREGSNDSVYSRTIQYPFKAKITYTFTWATLRYRIEIASTGKHVPPPYFMTGKCELINPSK
jgi:hypothetical protein